MSILCKSAPEIEMKGELEVIKGAILATDLLCTLFG